MILLFSLITFLSEFIASSGTAEILFAGDAMQHSAQLDAARRADGTYDYSGYFSALEPYIKSAHYAVVNLETPLGGKGYSGYPAFCAPDAYARALRDSGFDLMLTANNHMLDRRDRGLLRTISALDSLGVDHTGIYTDNDDRRQRSPLIVSICGFRVAFLNYTYATNGITIQGLPVINYLDPEQIDYDIASARHAGAEIVIVCPHWGDEYRLLPNESQKRLADRCLNAGADMVIGSHPHVIQPIEMRIRPDGRKALVVYSLGNFISNMRTTDTRGGAMVRVRLRRSLKGRAEIDTASYRLVFTEPPSQNNRNFRLVPAEASDDPRARAFERNAMQIYKKHNIGIERDTTSIRHKEIAYMDAIR